MDIYIQSQVGVCEQFKESKDADPHTVSIVIAPLRVQGTEARLKVVTGCNMYKNCYNEDCFYSMASRVLSGTVEQ
ncbi:MAG: hypothetical protein M0R06_17545 [Sphaerochaeta sp.]|jgi:hypothetical protein|nr:hypothetical protein [Sphaerochaeta sp.]